MSRMKTSLTLLLFFIGFGQAFSQPVSEKKFTIYCLGSEYSPQTIAFKKDCISKKDEINLLFAPYNYKYIDAENPDTTDIIYKYVRTLTYKADLPVFAGVDKDGYIVFYKRGYHIDTLKKYLNYKLFSAYPKQQKLTSLPEYKKYEYSKFRKFQEWTVNSRWKLGAEIGTNFFNIASSDYNKYKTGYYGKIYTKHLFHNAKNELDMGFAFNSIGGRNSSNESIRLNYLQLPVNYNRYISKLFKRYGNIYTSVGVYGGYLSSHHQESKNTPDISDNINKWDAGMNAGVHFAFGTFRLAAVYNRGLVDLHPTTTSMKKAFNNGFSIGASINLGQ